MEEFVSFMEELNIWTILIRVFLAALAGGLVGIERELHGRAAGLRTHMMVALGAALTSMVSVFIIKELELDTDASRLAAQVISGVGFIGAGTIILSRSSSRIVGLTTAAGLWTSACVGLAVGFGFYFGAFATVVAAVLVFTLIGNLEKLMHSKSMRISVYLEVDIVDSVNALSPILKEQFAALEIQVTPPRSATQPHVGMEALITVGKNGNADDVLAKLKQLDHVIFALQNF